MKGYAVSQRFERLEYRMAKTEEKIDFILNTSLPPREGKEIIPVNSKYTNARPGPNPGAGIHYGLFYQIINAFKIPDGLFQVVSSVKTPKKHPF